MSSAAATASERPKSAAAPTPPATSPKPKGVINTIGHYEMDKNIGEGNFAKVRLARHSITGQQVAIKIIDKNKLDKATSKKLFREVRIMRLLSHKNIVKLYEVIDTPDELYLIMEYVSGGEIFDYLVAHGRMKEKDARRHFRQIVGAVAYCHNLHIIHRDLKAENLLLDEHMNVKIADFGFSNQFLPGQKLNTWCGSPPYAAPELFQGKEYSGPEVDVWSLGVVLYVFVCGSLPFDGSNLAKLRARVIAGKFQIPFYMSPDCEKFIKKMLVIDPAKRITVDQMLQEKWYTEGCENEPPQVINPSQNQAMTAEQQKSILDELEELGLERDAVLKSINEGTYDSLSATYYLVADRRANGLPATTPTKTAAVKPVAAAKNSSKVNVLDVLNEDADPEAPAPARKPTKKEDIQAMSAPCEKPKTASHAQPARVVSGRRRAATIDSNNKSGQESGSVSVPPPLQKIKPTVPPEFTTTTAAAASMDQKAPGDQPAPLPPITTAPSGRARAHTVAVDKTDDDQDTPIPIDQFRLHLQSPVEPRTARFTFSVSTTSNKDAAAVFGIVKAALVKGGATVTTDGMVATAGLHDLEFEIEVCRLPNLQVVGLRCKRLMGDAWAYKEALSAIIATMDL